MDRRGATLHRDADGAPEEAMRSSGSVTGSVEVRGGLLSWDLRSPALLPDAVIHDAERAEAWVGAVFGPALAQAVAEQNPRYAAEPFGFAALRRPAPLLRALRSLAWLRWAETCWPAGSRVPPLSHALLSAETAVTTASVSEVLEDPDAARLELERARGSRAALRALERNESLGPAATALGERLDELLDSAAPGPTDASRRARSPLPRSAPARTAPEADDVREPPASPQTPDPSASAAGDRFDTLPIEVPAAEGVSVIDRSRLRSGFIDAESDARWEIIQLGPSLRLRVETTAAPQVEFPFPEPRGEAGLIVRYGPEESGIEAPLRLTGTVYRAETEVPAAALLVPVQQRTVRIVEPGHAATSPAPSPPLSRGEAAAASEASIEVALDRLRRAGAGDPAVSLAERAAAFHAG